MFLYVNVKVMISRCEGDFKIKKFFGALRKNMDWIATYNI